MRRIIIAAVAAIVLMAFVPQKKTTIFIIGDSTAAKKDLSTGSPERGWGMALQCYFDDAFITVDNHAVNGRSSRSFINEGRWDKVLSLMKPGDYVIIQFGHNDEKPQETRHTDPGSTFDYNLAKFVRETREKGGIPILMNPVVRRNYTLTLPKGEDEALRDTKFGDAPKTIEGDTLVDTHGLYAVAPRDVAMRMNCYFIDANKITHDLETSLGKEGSKKLHMWYKPDEHPGVPGGRQDNTHYNIYGAHQVASLFADALCEEIPLLSKYRTHDNPCKMEH
ncbi:MAG: rhamnogalacturonan acetylesterase [Prevotella sp.]|jgi:pectinesterase|nr:rhamnogalacturonan acetylesterase [Prevotella sp.]MCR5151961.1 rhamnogalacturonan acetylesterase [Prevotella sp.]